jgi:hypothetical protein
MQICTFTCFCFLILIAARLKNIGGLDMKKNILSWRFFLLVVFSLIFLQNQLTAQCWPNINTPPHPSVGVNYDGRLVAYVTNGQASGTIPTSWVSSPSIWNICKGSGVNPPLSVYPNNSYGQIYFQISAGDNVKVSNLLLRNNMTLVVCGNLTITEDFIEGEPPDGESGQLNNVKIIVCSTGTLSMKGLNVKNNVQIIVDGVLVVEEINSTSGGGGGALFCMWSTTNNGVIQTYNGGIPTINGNYAYSQTGDGNNCNLTTTGGITLPIELLSFTPEIRPDRIELKWTTGTEINNDFFTIERSRDMYGWEVLGFVQGAGNSSVPLSYSFSDLRPLDGLAYYRLKQTDFDGKFEYFGPIAAHYDLGMEGLDFKVLKQYTNWVIAVPNDGVYQVEVYNLQGHRLVSEKIENTITIPAPDGAVVIRVTDGFARSASRVVM